MFRIFSYCVALLMISSFLTPTLGLAKENDHTVCALDGYIAANNLQLSITESETASVAFSLGNSSDTYSYAGVELGLALYESETATIPSFWSPVVSEVVIHPQAQQDFEVELDMQYVPVGEYVARIGLSQAGQLAAMVDSRDAELVSFSKQTPGSSYPFTLTASLLERNGADIQYTLTTENDGQTVLRDYTQHVSVSRGATAVGSAIVSDVATPVKIIPGKQETSRAQVQVAIPGEYYVYGYSQRPQVMLPVVTDTLTVGTEQVSTANAYITAVGLSGLADDMSKSAEVVACVAATEDGTADVRQLEILVTTEETGALTSSITDVAMGEQGEVSFSKQNLDTFTVAARLYQSAGQVPDQLVVADVVDSVGLGNVEQSIKQTLVCGNDCQPISLTQTAENFTAEETVQTAIWFYVGIITAAALLFFLMMGRLKSPSSQEDEEPMHIPE